MDEKTKSQSSFGKQGTKNLQELSEWDKNLLSDMDNGWEDLGQLIDKERAKLREQREK